MQGYQAVYARLGVRLEERGESFYNPMLPSLVQWLMEHNIAEESEGAKVVFVKVSLCCHCTGCVDLSAQSLKCGGSACSCLVSCRLTEAHLRYVKPRHLHTQDCQQCSTSC